jgi:hypothetical protein
MPELTKLSEEIEVRARIMMNKPRLECFILLLSSLRSSFARAINLGHRRRDLLRRFLAQNCKLLGTAVYPYRYADFQILGFFCSDPSVQFFSKDWLKLQG